MENGKTGIINPFVHISDKLEEKQITKAFLHPGDEGYDSEMIGSKHVVNALAYGTENTVAEKTPIAKAFLHEGDDGFDKAMSFADIEIAMLDKPIFIPSEGTKATSQGQNKATNEGSNNTNSDDSKAYKISLEMIRELDFRRCSERLFVRRGNVHALLIDKAIKEEVFAYLEKKGYDMKISLINNVKFFLELNRSIKEEKGSSTEYIAFLNGVILDNQLLRVFPGRDTFITHKINASYNPSIVGRCPTMSRFVETTMGGNPMLIKRLWQSIAFVLSNASAKKFLVLEGVGNSGKSKLINLLENLFTDDVFPLKLEDFGEKFLLDKISGRKLITCADLPKSVIGGTAIGNIKAITGGDKINGQAKFGDPYTLETGGSQRIVFATNHAITIKEKDDAFTDRIVYVPFVNAVSPEERDPELLDKLILEKDAIVTTALQYLPELLATNFTFAGEEETEALLSVYNAYVNRDFSEIVEGFLAENIELAPDVFTSTEEILNAFTEKTGVYIDSSNFGKYVKSVLLNMSPSITEARATINGTKSRGYRGIRIKEEPANGNIFN